MNMFIILCLPFLYRCTNRNI